MGSKGPKSLRCRERQAQASNRGGSCSAGTGCNRLTVEQTAITMTTSARIRRPSRLIDDRDGMRKMGSVMRAAFP